MYSSNRKTGLTANSGVESYHYMPKPLAKDASLQMRSVIPQLTQCAQHYEGGDDAGTFVWLRKSVDQKNIQAMCIEFDRKQQKAAAPALEKFASISGLGGDLDHVIETAKKNFSHERPTHRETNKKLGATIYVTDFAKTIAVRVDYD